MRCAGCEAENPDTARDCSACGETLERRCPGCEARVSRRARFCAECGRALGDASRVAERKRQITVLFADLDESTPLAHALELEDLQGLLRSFQELCATEIERYGGRVVQHLGDGVLAYFGEPSAHEDDAARAIRAALGIVAGTERLAARVSTFATGMLTARAGIHTGVVVVGEMGSGAHREKLAVGEAVNLASRVLGTASANEVIVTGATQRLAGPGFEVEALGERALRGVADAVTLYRVRGLSHGDARSTPRSPFIGRERELARLEALLASAARGELAALAIAGEAGIGKSRLLAVFRERVESLGGDWIEWRCSRFMEQTPFHPVASALERRLESRLASGEDARDSGPEARALDALRELQSSETSASDNAPDTPEARRHETISALAAAVTSRCVGAPVVLALEDAQWADPSTLELLGILAAGAAGAPPLIVATHRPEYQPSWFADPGQTLTLAPLGRSESRELVDAILGAHEHDDAIRDALVARSDGVPLFLEEMVRALLDTGTALAGSMLPTSLRSLLDSRLDRVPAARVETLRLASALGRDFRLSTLAAVSTRTEDSIRDDLRALEVTGLVMRDPGRDDTFAFKHVLVQEAVYESMLRDERSRLHLQVARALEQTEPALAAEQPEVLAHHLTQGGRIEQALGYWKRAGERATERGAYREAIGLFDRGLALAAGLPRSSELLHSELAFEVARGTALFSTLGYADPRVEQSFARAGSMCEQIGGEVPLFVLYGMWAVHLCRSDRVPAETALARMRERVGSGEAVAELTAAGCTGLRAFLGGEFERCRVEMDAGIRWFETAGYQAFVEDSHYEGHLYLLAYRMWSSWILGDIDLATRHSEELSALARRARTPYGPCIARGFRINLFRDRGDVARVRAISERQLAHATKQLIYFWQGPAHCGHGWALAREGELDAGIAEIEQGLALMRAVGLTTTLPYHQSALVEALLARGEPKQALESARSALEICEHSLDQFYEAELRRLEGEALHALGEEAASLRALEAALELARRQGARSYELRAALSLSRVHGREGVASVLAGFSDGFDTADLRAARALLEMSR